MTLMILSLCFKNTLFNTESFGEQLAQHLPDCRKWDI